MANGLPNHDSGQGSDDKIKPPTADLPRDAVDSEALDVDSECGADELSDAPVLLASDAVAPEEVEVRVEMANVARTEHPLRRIEAHWETKRLNDLLREVYDEE